METCYSDIEQSDDAGFTVPYQPDSKITGFDIESKKGVEYLPNNLATAFPDLVGIRIRSCSVKSIENHFRGLPKLEVIDLHRNKIENISEDAFVDLINLEALAMGYNRIKFLAENIFSKLFSLKEILLDNNRIQVLHPRIFGSFRNVLNINFGQNGILVLPENILENATSLEEVLFYANKLERVPRDLFKNNLKLRTCTFDINNIKFIDFNLFNHLSTLKHVNLKFNKCIDKIYFEHDIKSIKNDLKQSCSDSGSSTSILCNSVLIIALLSFSCNIIA